MVLGRRRARAPLLALLLPALTSCGPTVIDWRTPASATSLHDGSELELIMSDEFEDDEPRDWASDAVWRVVERPDYAAGALHFYSKEMVSVREGSLRIKTTRQLTTFRDYPVDAEGSPLRDRPVVESKRSYSSGLLESWNKFCFRGGVIEARFRLPGVAGGGTVWPAVWLLGNLARAGHEDANSGVWPWSYDTCALFAGSPRRRLPLPPHPPLFFFTGDERSKDAQRISACDATPGFGLHPNKGRGAPQLDVFEMKPSLRHGTPSSLMSSLQAAPGESKNRPLAGMPSGLSTVACEPGEEEGACCAARGAAAGTATRPHSPTPLAPPLPRPRLRQRLVPGPQVRPPAEGELRVLRAVQGRAPRRGGPQLAGVQRHLLVLGRLGLLAAPGRGRRVQAVGDGAGRVRAGQGRRVRRVVRVVRCRCRCSRPPNSRLASPPLPLL